MTTSLQFLGAARNVTGSRYVIENNGCRILVDSGLYQERDLAYRNWEPFPVPPSSIHAVLLTHAHLDHCGYLPRLARDGFSGPIFCTHPTAEIAKIVLLDSAHLQEEDAAFKRKRHAREKRKGPFPEEALYGVGDVEKMLPQFVPVDYGAIVRVGNTMEVLYYNAGHILGSSIIKLTCTDNGKALAVLFSGDIGRFTVPLLHDPERGQKADYIQIESTYGDRRHPDSGLVKDRLSKIINETFGRGGNLVIPSFAVERTQELLYYIHTLIEERRIPQRPVFVDSPMASKVTAIYGKYPHLQDPEIRDYILKGQSPFGFKGLQLVSTADESKAINHLKGSSIIIAGSGMCTGGRIKHHLANNISRAESTILFVGYQAKATLGRLILDRPPEVRILGQIYKVRAVIEQLHGFSGHADQEELIQWISGLSAVPRRVFVTHGEPEAAETFAATLKTRTGWAVVVPRYAETIQLQTP